MDNTNWKYFYKVNSSMLNMASNMLYTPTMNEDGSILCMHYCKDNIYRTVNEVTDDVITFFFKRELRFLKELKDYKFTPTVIEVDEQQQKIFIEWNKDSLSQIIHDPNRSLDTELPDWKEQLYNIIKSLNESNYYKMALYPHCFFIDKNKNIKTFDYYSIIPQDERFLDRSIIESIIGKEGAYRFDQSTVDGKIDFKTFFDITMTKHLENYWPENPFPVWYNELFND
jgi:hypothetical protein